jgi:sugar lactone lactonase YvrE
MKRLSNSLVGLAVAVTLFVVLPWSDPAGGGEPGKAALPKVSVIAGGGTIGDGMKATEATLAGIGSLVVDARGHLYFSDIGRNRVRRVDAGTGVLTTIAGTGGVENTASDGTAEGVDLFTPGPLVLDAAGTALYIGEVAGKRVLRVDLSTHRIEDLGAPPQGFGQVTGLLWTPQELLVVDTLRGQVWSREGESWKARFARPEQFPGGIRNVVQDRAGNLYLSEFFSHRLLRWVKETGGVETLAGTLGKPGRAREGAVARESLLWTPDGLTTDGEGNLYFAEMNNRRIARLDAATGKITTLFEAAVGDAADRWAPGPLFRDDRGRFWVGDAAGNRVLRFTPGRREPEVIAGGGDIGDGGPATQAVLAHPGCLAVDRQGNVYIADAMLHRVRRVDLATGRIETVAGTGFPGYNGDGIPARRAQLNYPGGLLVDESKDRLFIGDYYNNRVRMVDLKTGIITTIAGNGGPGAEGDGGPAVQATMLNPHAITMDEKGRLIVTSAVAQSVRRIDLERGVIESLSLDPRMVPPQRVLVFYDIAFSKGGFFLADGMRDQVLFVMGDRVSQVAARPDLRYPMGLAVSPHGELFVSDTRNNRVVRWTGEKIEVVADHLGRPRDITFDREGNLYVADTFHNRVLKISGVAPPPALSSTPRDEPSAVGGGGRTTDRR